MFLETRHENAFADLLNRFSKLKNNNLEHQQARNDTFELEVRFGGVTAEKFWRMLSALEKQNYKKTTMHTYEEVYNIKELDNKNNEHNNTFKKITDLQTKKISYIKKRPLKKYDVYDYNIRFSLSQELPIDYEKLKNKKNTKNSDLERQIENSQPHVRNKIRYSYDLVFSKLDLTIINNTSYEIELEVGSQVDDHQQKIMGLVQVVLQTLQNNYYLTSSNTRKFVLDEYKKLVGNTRFIGAQPETLHRNKINILYKNNYSVTDKADGERVFLFIASDNSVFLIDNNIQEILITDIKYIKNLKNDIKNTILDGELVRHESKFYFLAFDIIFYSGKDLRGNKDYLLRTRLDLCKQVLSSLDNGEFFIRDMKTYIFENVFLGSEVLMSEKKFYENDGLIFTPLDEPYPTTKKWKSLLKWKPQSHNTIDFYSVKDYETNKWKLFVQHPVKNSDKGKNTDIELFDINLLFPDMSNDFNYTTYETEFDENLFVDRITNMKFISNTVIEYYWDTVENKFLPIRTRWDKTSNPSKHGNFSAIAFDIWQSIHNPIELDFLLKFTTGNKTDNYFENMRRFHNKIKESLYNKYTNNIDNLLELASGRGGDLHKWIYNKIKNVVGYDISEKNIQECEKRVKQMSERENKITTKTDFKQLDLCKSDAPEKIVKDFVKSSQEKPFDTVSCQFAVHYLFQSENCFKNLIKILDSVLKYDGYFICTFMDKKKIDELLDDKAHTYKIDKSTNKVVYYISKKTENEHSPFGNKLRIVLDGNNILETGSDEYIVDFEKFKNLMQTNDYELVESKLFEMEYSKYKQHSFSEFERDISWLNRYAVFKKSSPVDIDTEIQDFLPNIETPELKRIPKSDFKTIDLHKNELTATKINSSYDIIDVINCIEYKYYTKRFDNQPVENFEDIKQTFKNYNIKYKPIQIHNINDTSEFYNISKANKQIYFTEYVHETEQRTETGDTEIVTHNNWYILMRDSKLLFSSEQTETSDEIVSELQTEETEETSNEEQQILDYTELKLSELKILLKKMGLKTSGKKQELVNRIQHHKKFMNSLS